MLSPAVQPKTAKLFEAIQLHSLAIPHLVPALMRFYTGKPQTCYFVWEMKPCINFHRSAPHTFCLFVLEGLHVRSVPHMLICVGRVTGHVSPTNAHLCGRSYRTGQPHICWFVFEGWQYRSAPPIVSCVRWVADRQVFFDRFHVLISVWQEIESYP